jgi:GntR family transcriptional regulator
MPRRVSALYEKTIAFILGYIDDEALGAGAQLPTEPQLAAMAGVSLVTVRRALAELAAQSVVRREQGRGTFVARPRVRTEPTRIGNLRNGLLLDARSSLTTQLLGVGKRPATADECEALGLAGDAFVWDVSRLRLLNDRPLIWERSAIPVLLAPELDRHLQEDSTRSLYGILDAEYGLREGREEQQLLTRAATTQEHQLLALRHSEWVVEITGVSVSVRQVPIDRFRMVFAGQSFSFRLSSAPLSALEAIERI